MQNQEPSQTALRVALSRAIESRYPETRRICWDPFAQYFLCGQTRKIYDSWLRRKLFCLRSEKMAPGVIGSVMVRTRFIDDYLAVCIAAGIKQLVILGAGYDTRALRFEALKKEVTVFEVDHPATQQRKTAVLQNRFGDLPEHVVFVAVRFNSESLADKLLTAGYQTDVQTLFIWEGVTYYITVQAVDDTLTFVTDYSGCGSSIVFDYFPPSVADGTCHLKEARALRSLFGKLGEGLTFGIAPESIETYLAAKGFGQIRNYTHQDLQEKYFKKSKKHRRLSKLFAIAHATVLSKD